MNLRSRPAALLAAALLAVAPLAAAQTYPDRPVHVVVSFPPGGGTDTITRIVTEPLGKVLGQKVVIENRAGGNTIIGAQAVTSAKPDGYTLLSTLDMTATILPAVYSRLPFDPSRDLVPVALLAHVPALFVAHPSVPARDLKELAEYSKGNPGKLNYASAVLYGQLLGELLKSASGISYNYVPYKGAADAMQALIGGHVDFLMLDIATGLNYIKAGKLKALAITAPQRHPQLPDVPTVAEMGYPGIEMSVWYALFAPAGTPAGVVDRLNASVAQVLADPSVKRRLADLGHETATPSPKELVEMIRKDSAKWSKAARDGNVKLD